MTAFQAPASALLEPWQSPPVDDGDAERFCTTCVFGRVCLPKGYSKHALHRLHCLIEHVGPFQAGQTVFRIHEPFNAVYSVRAGLVKTVLIDERGREQVLGFYTPGEMIGLDAVHTARYSCSAIALDTTLLCRFSFGAMANLAQEMPDLQHTLFQLMSRNIAAAQWGRGDYPADVKFAGFLLDWGQRLAKRGFSAKHFVLPMARTDIASFLSLAPETVSRVIRKLSDDGIATFDRREVTLLKPDLLKRLAGAMPTFELE